MADLPREGRLARSPEFTQLIDMASESMGGKVSGSPAAKTRLTVAMRRPTLTTAQRLVRGADSAEGSACLGNPLLREALENVP